MNRSSTLVVISAEGTAENIGKESPPPARHRLYRPGFIFAVLLLYFNWHGSFSQFTKSYFSVRE
jgi:hypothetical protein